MQLIIDEMTNPNYPCAPVKTHQLRNQIIAQNLKSYTFAP